MSLIAKNITAAKNIVLQAATRSARSPDEITLLAVSKRISTTLIQDAIAAGQTCFGENRVQDATEKIPALPSHLHWHFIGALQKNKIRKILPITSTLHGINSLEIATAVDRIASELGITPDIYLQVNIAQESSKQGFSPQGLADTIEQIASLPNIQPIGLMTIPPFSPDPEKTRPHFQSLRNLRDQLAQSHGIELPGLSMGMSNDFAVAIEEGSTIVRLGTTIFGPRTPPN